MIYLISNMVGYVEVCRFRVLLAPRRSRPRHVLEHSQSTFRDERAGFLSKFRFLR